MSQTSGSHQFLNTSQQSSATQSQFKKLNHHNYHQLSQLLKLPEFGHQPLTLMNMSQSQSLYQHQHQFSQSQQLFHMLSNSGHHQLDHMKQSPLAMLPQYTKSEQSSQLPIQTTFGYQHYQLKSLNILPSKSQSQHQHQYTLNKSQSLPLPQSGHHQSNHMLLKQSHMLPQSQPSHHQYYQHSHMYTTLKPLPSMNHQSAPSSQLLKLPEH
jgi:hypothetical protein